MDYENTVHISIVEAQLPISNEMDSSDLQDSARSSLISVNSSGTSGASETDEASNRDSVISYSSMDSLSSGVVCGLGRCGSTRSMPPERTTRPDSEPEDHVSYDDMDGVSLKGIVQNSLSRKTAIRRHHTLTPSSSPKVRDRRNRSISSTEPVPIAQLGEHVPKEYFTVSFGLRYYNKTHKLEALKGKTLKEVIRPILAEAQLDIRTIDIFIESSSTPTPLELSASPLSGRHLYVRAATGKVLGNSPRSRRKSMDGTEGFDNAMQPSQPQKKDLAKIFGINQADQVNAKTRRVSVPIMPQGIIGKENTSKEKLDPKLVLLYKKLDDYMILGLPDFPALLTFSSKREDDDECFKLEESWRAFIDDVSHLTKKEMDQQEAMWEIIKTEVDYIKNIRVVVDFYLCTLINLQASMMLNEIETEKIFSNITAIEILHTRFWKEKLSIVVKNARDEKRIPSVLDMMEAFEGFPELLSPYIKFCTDEAACLRYLREKTKNNDMLRFFVEWALRHPNSRRLKLQDLLVYPMQRITKYPLLLHAVEKKTLDEQDLAVVSNRILEVKEFVMRVNHELRQEEERQKMEKTVLRLEGYDAVSSPNSGDELAKLIEEHSNLDIMSSMPNAPPQRERWLLMEGALKLRDADTRVDAYAFLFTDMLVLAKQRKGEHFRVIKSPMRVDKIRVQELKDGGGFALVVLDDYLCAAYGCVLTTTISTTWLTKIRAAKDLYNSICSCEDDYQSGGPIDDGSGEPDTSPEAMLLMQNNTFSFPDLSPTSSPLVSPMLAKRHNLSVDIRRARSSTSLSNGGLVSPVLETEEDEMKEEKEEDNFIMVSNARSEEDLLNTINSVFPNHKRESLKDTETGVRPMATRASSEDNLLSSSRTDNPPQATRPTAIRPPSLLSLPTPTNLSCSPVSPVRIISFDDEDSDEGLPQDRFLGSTSPQRKMTTVALNTAKKKVPNKNRRYTTGMDPKSKGKLNNLLFKLSPSGKS